MNKKVAALLVFAFALTMFGGISRADQVLASSVAVDRLAKDANLVVRVKANEVEQAQSRSQRRVIRSVNAEVLEVIKGDVKAGDKIRFLTDRKIDANNEVVVFLTGGSSGVYSVAGLNFGVYDVKLTKDNKQSVIMGAVRRDAFRGVSTRVPNLSKSLSGKEAAAINTDQREIPVEDFTSILRQIVREQESSDAAERSAK